VTVGGLEVWRNYIGWLCGMEVNTVVPCFQVIGQDKKVLVGIGIRAYPLSDTIASSHGPCSINYCHLTPSRKYNSGQ
jgi:hypothetical protein